MKLWLPTDLIIGEIQSLRFAPGLETVSQAPCASLGFAIAHDWYMDLSM